MPIVERARRNVRRQLKSIVRRPLQPEMGRRALAVLRLMDGASVAQVAALVEAARSTIYRWARWYRAGGLEALCGTRRGRRAWTVDERLCTALLGLLERSPQALGYLRSTWSSELMAMALREYHGVVVHPSTLRRLLPRLGIVWRRARPTLHKRDPRKTERLAAIGEALDSAGADTAVFYVDEADVELLPRIGYGWRPRGVQQAVPTPGQNRKHYLAGALNARSGRLVWVEHPAKNTELFIKLLETLRERYRRAQRIVLILDNYIIHKTRRVSRWLAQNPKFELRFQPVYHPWVNRIERLWKAMHDTVTRNHRCTSLTELCQHVARFLHVVQPFPGARHGVAHFGSAI